MARSAKCTFRKSTGRQCQANAMSDSQFCFFHDPNVSVKRKEAQRSGGKKNRAVVLSSELPDLALRSVGHVVSLLGATVNQVREGELDGTLNGSRLMAGEARFGDCGAGG